MPLPGVHLDLLPERDVAGLGLGDAQLGLQLAGLHHLGQQRAGGDPLPELERQVLEDAVVAGLHLHRVHQLLAEAGHRPSFSSWSATRGVRPRRLFVITWTWFLPQLEPLVEVGRRSVLRPGVDVREHRPWSELLVRPRHGGGVGRVGLELGHARLLAERSVAKDCS
jgi:hypothetical protein